MLKALQKEEWRESISPVSWMLGVLDNVILATARKRRLEAVADIDAAIDPSTSCEAVLDALVAEQEVADQMERIARLAQAAELNDRERQVLAGRLRDGSYEGIAAALVIGENAARAFHSQAVAKIRAALQETPSIL